MAVCVGCGLEISGAGKLQVKVDPAGGITCGDAGLSAAAAIASSDDAAITCCNEAKAQAAAAHTAANEADDTADAAQGTANTANGKADTALDRIPARIRWGFRAGTTNGAGDIDFDHTLGVLPASVVLQPHASSGTHVWTCVIENLSSSNVNVRIHDTTTGAAMPGQAVGFSWIATSP